MNNVEIERKFLLKDNSYKSIATCHHSILQGYLCKDHCRTVRVRICGDKAFLTIKSNAPHDHIARFEWEKAIDVQEAKELLKLALPGLIEKTRWIVPAQSSSLEQLVWEIDEFHGRLEGCVLAEIELKSEDQTFTIPDFIGKEVTSDPNYYNANM